MYARSESAYPQRRLASGCGNLAPPPGVDPCNTNRFVYDGWNLLAILHPPFCSPTSGVWTGAARSRAPAESAASWPFPTSQPSTHYACYDGNGNVMALVSAANGQPSAQYEYGPFGEVIRATVLPVMFMMEPPKAKRRRWINGFLAHRLFTYPPGQHVAKWRLAKVEAAFLEHIGQTEGKPAERFRGTVCKGFVGSKREAANP